MLSAFIKKLLFARQFLIMDGKIEVLGTPQVMLSSLALAELQIINKKKVYSLIKDVIHKNFVSYGKKLGAKGPDMLLNLEEIYETLGLGKLEIVDLDAKKKKAIVKVHHSPVAETHIKNKIKSKEPVCISIAGALAGMFTFLLGKQVDCTETDCVVLGKKFCQFMVK